MSEENRDNQIEDTLDHIENEEISQETPVNQEFDGETPSEDPVTSSPEETHVETPEDNTSMEEPTMDTFQEEPMVEPTVEPEVQKETPSGPGRVMRFEDFINQGN